MLLDTIHMLHAEGRTGLFNIARLQRNMVGKKR